MISKSPTGQPVYNKIGEGYNTTRRADPQILERILSLLSPEKGKLYLDIGCGTGNYTIALAKKSYSLYGVDPSEKMLEVAREKSDNVNWVNGAVEHIPFEDAFFDGALATLTIHHWKSLNDGFTELNRVLKPGARLLCFTSTPEQMRGYWLNHYFPEMLKKSIEQMPSLESVSDAATEAGFINISTEKFFVYDGLQDHFLHVGKNKPELYFDENIRKGISTFAALSNAKEVKSGLEKLKSDMEHGTFTEVKDSYNNKNGDYLFVIAEKTHRHL